MSYVKKPSVVKIDPTVTHLQPDQFDNDDPIQGYPFGTSVMRVTTATGFPETSGDVITSRTTDDTGSQIFIGEKAYVRTFEGAVWSSWREFGSVSGVTSVNGKTGDVVLTAEDVGAETPDGAQTKADQAEQNAKGYTDQEVSKVQDDLAAHLADNAAHGVGDRSALLTTAKDTLVNAINELFTFANDGKTQIANAITAKGVPADPTETFSSLAMKIGQISTGKKWASGSGTTSNYLLSVRGLDFMPSTVILTRKAETSSKQLRKTVGSRDPNLKFNDGTNLVVEIEATNQVLAYEPSSVQYFADGFDAYFLRNSGITSIAVDWMAFE